LDATLYNGAYTVHLPRTSDGFMIMIEASVTDIPFVETIYAALRRYRKHPADIMSKHRKRR
jgi:hypothetical protein